MATQSWTYRDVEGTEYEVMIYHGEKSGHVLILSRELIIKIDFSVKTDKIYSFYLGHELFEIRIIFKKDLPKYVLKNIETNTEIINPKVITYPFSHILKAFALVFGIGIVGLIIYKFL